MLVYGDAERVESVGEKRATILEMCRVAERIGPGLDRHAALVSAFITLSELAQGVADAAFEERGVDAPSRDEAAALSALLGLARAVDESWRSGFAQVPLPWPDLGALDDLAAEQAIRTKEAEGYAFYALYPESYLEAARRSGLGPHTTVIGIRSIGTGLAALVAAGLAAPRPTTVRPVGHPFRRELRVDEAFAKVLAGDPDRPFAVVDEGPGLSGSSFGSVADWIEARGVARGRIHFFPSHGGDVGPQASVDHRARWSTASRHWVAADELLLGAENRLATWVADLLGPLDGPLKDLSGGAWRSQRYPSEASWPAANVQQERRKFLAQSDGAAFLVKFAGLGAAADEKLARAQQLAANGFGSEVVGLRYGFLVERWIDAPSLDRAQFDRAALVEQIGAYLAFRARTFPAPAARGASLAELALMACHNTREGLGAELAEALEPRLARAQRLEERVRRICTDNRLHVHEWLVVGDRLVKTDALDHCAAHDLVGCQDVAWDVAGAAVEFDLDAEERARLCSMVERQAGRAVDRELLDCLEPCYLAFQLGAATLAATAIGGDEALRIRAAAERYGASLRALVRA